MDIGGVFVPNQFGNEFRLAESRIGYESRFKDFIRDFRVNNSFIYRDALRQHLNQNLYWLSVNLDDLTAFDEELSDNLKHNPSEFLSLFSNAAKEVAIAWKLNEQTNNVNSSSLMHNETIQDIQIILESSQNTIPLRNLVVISS